MIGPGWISRRRDRLLILLLLLLFPGGLVAEPSPAPRPETHSAPAPVAPSRFPRGELVERVACAADPQQAYALYLPSTYTADRRWPILYAFDARGQAERPAEVFREAAERFGWILVSSYNTASDGPMEPNFTAMHALWADTHARFAIDDKRMYAAGYSGTVRFACILALAAPGSIAGIIGAGAGFPFDTPPKAGNPFVFFGTVGDRDFNYYEMMNLDRSLAAVAVPHRIELWAGGHEWPPAELAGRAVAWMELAAMRSGLRPRAPEIVETEWGTDRERAREQEAAGTLWRAHHTWEAMASGFDGLRDVAEARQRATEIAAGKPYQKEANAHQELIDRDLKVLAEARQILARAAAAGSDEPVTAAQIAAALGIPRLRKQLKSTDPEEHLSAARILNTLMGQTAFYQPQRFLETKDYDRAVFMLQIAAQIAPESPEIWVSIASAHARKGAPGRAKALAALREAVRLGLADPAALADEPAFEVLRQDEEFARLTAEVARRHAPAEAANGSHDG